MLVGRFDLAHAARILVNLVENAHRYSPPGSPIVLHAQRDGEWLRLTVSDRGPGVALAERERIFEPFYRPVGAIADSRGVGLGLSIARRLSELQGGRLLYTPRDGGGSHFTLFLQAADLPTEVFES
jgi:two-component system sensor histidine kinase KdpD